MMNTNSFIGWSVDHVTTLFASSPNHVIPVMGGIKMADVSVMGNLALLHRHDARPK